MPGCSESPTRPASCGTAALACVSDRCAASLGDAARLARHLGKHRQDLFTLLKVPGLDATNYRAEQAMRPAAVNRKVWGGNRTPAGAHAQSVLMTVLATCRQQARDSLGVVADILRGRRVRLALLPSGP